MKNVPFGEIESFNVIIEVPVGSEKKYTYDHEMEAFKLSRVLYNEVNFPFNYGYVAETESGDGENLDVFVLSTHPISRGTVVTSRAVGIIELIDRGKEDHKLIAIPLSEPKWSHVKDIKDLPIEFTRIFEEFYQELAKQWQHELQIKGFHGKDRAIKELLRTQILD